ncbi:hypothetical protein [Streptomyces sp. NPDC051162]
MAPALLRIDRALCLSKDGEIEGACRETADVLHALPAEYRKGLTLTRAGEVYRSVPPQHRTVASVRELGDIVRAA